MSSHFHVRFVVSATNSVIDLFNRPIFSNVTGVSAWVQLGVRRSWFKTSLFEVTNSRLTFLRIQTPCLVFITFLRHFRQPTPGGWHLLVVIRHSPYTWHVRVTSISTEHVSRKTAARAFVYLRFLTSSVWRGGNITPHYSVLPADLNRLLMKGVKSKSSSFDELKTTDFPTKLIVHKPTNVWITMTI